ncbi:P-loop NTPase family protein [Belnapia moabensis]|uniref:hypothetical protein n=1 Tax=Belnapia moabensis TaxID=365533 RepID=UPI0005BB6093|nr:hypothetical protein [Belnapia moabensis]
MTASPSRRIHLVERAMLALGGTPPAQHDAGAPVEAGTAAADTLPPRLTASAAPSAQPVSHPATQPISLETLCKGGYAALTGNAQRSRVREELGVVQHQVLRAVQAAKAEEGRIPRMVLVTSAKPGEGKTFCSLNIATSLAISAPEQVILVDADGKMQDSLTVLLGLAEKPGLRALATDPTCRPEMLPIPTVLRRLSVLSYGPSAPGASGLPSGQMLAAALSRLASALPGRILVVDAPPCLATSEPGALAAVAGQVLMVVRAEATQRGEVESALDMVDACPTLQLLLNRTHMVTSDGFGAYDYEGSHNSG